MTPVRWKELEPEIRLGSLTEVVRCLDCLSVLCAIANLAKGVRIYAMRSCVEAVLVHVRSEREEVGGLLLGRVYQANAGGRNPADTLILLTHCVRSADYRNSSVSLEMGTEVWCRANELISRENIVVGWYHSHPNLGAFFSGTDRRTQRAFFNHHYSMGWVIDPFRDEQKVFCGSESEEYQHAALVVDDWPGGEIGRSPVTQTSSIFKPVPCPDKPSVESSKDSS